MNDLAIKVSNVKIIYKGLHKTSIKKNLLGKKKNKVVEVQAPAGVIKLKILAIKK